MTFTFFRGDSRTPQEIRDAKGFQGWVPLSAEQARKIVIKGKKEASDFPPALAGIMNTVEIKKALDLQVFIKFTKNKSTTPQVSTAFDDDCGGQANGKDAKGRPYVIYKLQFDSLNVLLDNGGFRPLEAGDLPHTSMFPKVLMNDSKLETSTTIAICMKDEVAFLTSIPMANIKEYKEQGAGWKSM